MSNNEEKRSSKEVFLPTNRPVLKLSESHFLDVFGKLINVENVRKWHIVKKAEIRACSRGYIDVHDFIHRVVKIGCNMSNVDIPEHS